MPETYDNIIDAIRHLLRVQEHSSNEVERVQLDWMINCLRRMRLNHTKQTIKT